MVKLKKNQFSIRTKKFKKNEDQNWHKKQKHHYTILVNNNNEFGATILFQEVLVLLYIYIYIYENELLNQACSMAAAHQPLSWQEKKWRRKRKNEKKKEKKWALSIEHFI